MIFLLLSFGEDNFVPSYSIPNLDSKIYHSLDSAVLLLLEIYRIFYL